MDHIEDRDARCRRLWPRVWMTARANHQDPVKALIEAGLIDPFGPYATLKPTGELSESRPPSQT